MMRFKIPLEQMRVEEKL